MVSQPRQGALVSVLPFHMQWLRLEFAKLSCTCSTHSVLPSLCFHCTSYHGHCRRLYSLHGEVHCGVPAYVLRHTSWLACRD